MKLSEYTYTAPTQREIDAAVALIKISINHSASIKAAENAFNKISATDDISLYGFHFYAHDIVLDLLGVMSSNESEFEGSKKERIDQIDPELFSRDCYINALMEMKCSSIASFIKQVDREMKLISKGKRS